MRASGSMSASRRQLARRWTDCAGSGRRRWRPRREITRRRLRIRCEYRTTRCAELQLVLTQTCNNSGDVRDSAAAQPHHIGCARHLLSEGAAIFFRGGRFQASCQQYNSNRNLVHTHVAPPDFHHQGISAFTNTGATGRFISGNNMLGNRHGKPASMAAACVKSHDIRPEQPPPEQ